MKTPIFDYVNEYICGNPSRFHMPGHKGVPGFLGIEPRDITEIDGADELYLADGIIMESQKNAGDFFNANTFYSTEGSSLSIRAALALLVKWCRQKDSQSRPLILAGRNAHKTLINAAVVLDFDIDWIMPRVSDSYESCRLNPDELREIIAEYISSSKPLPHALYLTSPDYLGNILDIKALSEVCHEYGILLIVDNAHGAYLKFLEKSLHPIDQGADICCDSAHKTLPVLTGGAYLHIAKTNPSILTNEVNEVRSYFSQNAKASLALFGSTSPSYLILQSLDLCNLYLENLGQSLFGATALMDKIKLHLKESGYKLIGNEPLKLSIYFENEAGKDIAKILYEEKIIPEYYDSRHIVFMVSNHNTLNDMNRLVEFFDRDDIKKAADNKGPDSLSEKDSTQRISAPRRALSYKEAYFAPSESVPIKDSIGRVMSEAVLSCPPAVPLFMSGEVIDERILSNKEWIKEDTIKVVK